MARSRHSQPGPSVEEHASGEKWEKWARYNHPFACHRNYTLPRHSTSFTISIFLLPPLLFFFFSLCLSVDPSPYILATADKTADGRVWKLGEEGPSMAARNEPVVVVIEGGGGVRASLRPPTRLPLNIWINVDLSRVFFFFEQVWDESSSWKMFLWELLSFAKSRSFVRCFDL